MHIVITTTLNNNLFRAKLIPLVESRPGVTLTVISDRQGPDYDGITWVYPQGKLKWLGRLPARLILLLRETWKRKTQLVMAYSLVPHGLFAVLAAKSRGLPVYLHFIAGPAELWFAHDLRVTDNRLIENTSNPERWEKIAHFFARKADKIFVPGSVTKDRLSEDGFTDDKLQILHSTVDPGRFNMPTESSHRDIDVIVCAQLRERKRPLFTLKVLSELAKMNPDRKFVWLGDGGMHDEFEAEIKKLNLDNNLEWLSTDEVEKFFKRSKIFLLCSLNEGLSLASLEAMSCGTVAVAARCGDMEYAIKDGINGHLLEQDASVEDYVHAVDSLLQDQQQFEQFQHAAVQEMQQRHTFSFARSEWSKVLEKIEVKS